MEFSIKKLAPETAKAGCIVVGVHQGGELTPAARAAAAALKELGDKDAVLFLADLKVGSRPTAWNVRHAVLAVRDAFYRFEELKTQKKSPDPALGSVILPFSPNSQLEQT